VFEVAHGRRHAALLAWACAVALSACAGGESRAEPGAAIELDASQDNPDATHVADDAGPDADANTDAAADASADASVIDASDAMPDAAAMDAETPDASTDESDAHVNNGYAAPLAFADCTEPWGWESSPPAAQPPRVPATLGTVAPLAFELLDVEYSPAI